MKPTFKYLRKQEETGRFLINRLPIGKYQSRGNRPLTLSEAHQHLVRSNMIFIDGYPCKFSIS